jgi:hypothetical protein
MTVQSKAPGSDIALVGFAAGISTVLLAYLALR